MDNALNRQQNFSHAKKSVKIQQGESFIEPRPTPSTRKGVVPPSSHTPTKKKKVTTAITKQSSTTTAKLPPQKRRKITASATAQS